MDPSDLIKTLVIYFFLKSENLKAFTIYTVLIVYYMVHTENDGAPHSDKKPVETGSSYLCSVPIYNTSVQSGSYTLGVEISLKNGRFNSVPLATMTSNYLTNDSQRVVASLTHNTFYCKPVIVQNSS